MITGETPACNSFPETMSPTIAIMAPGKSNSPVWVGLKPSNRCAITGVRKIEVNMPTPVMNVKIAAILNCLLLKTRRFTTGCSTRNSHKMNAVNEMMDTTVSTVM